MKHRGLLTVFILTLASCLCFTHIQPAEASLWKLITARWCAGAGEVAEVRIDASTHSLQTINYEHHEIHAGYQNFVMEWYEHTDKD